MQLHILVVADAGGQNGTGVLEGLEIAQLVAAAATTLAAAIGAIPVVTAALASLTLLMTGLRQVLGFREKWATRTCALVRIEDQTNLYQLSRAHGGDAAGRRLAM